jgi:hypothetical protein
MNKIFLGIILISIIGFVSCKKTATVTPVSELIKKSWTPQTVREGSTTVYTKGGTGNIRAGYSSFVLNLSSPPSVSLTEFDGNTFTGTYELQGDTRLILKGLNPQPTGSGGTIEFTISSATATNLELSRTTANQKTGGTINSYSLVVR